MHEARQVAPDVRTQGLRCVRITREAPLKGGKDRLGRECFDRFGARIHVPGAAVEISQRVVGATGEDPFAARSFKVDDHASTRPLVEVRVGNPMDAGEPAQRSPGRSAEREHVGRRSVRSRLGARFGDGPEQGGGEFPFGAQGITGTVHAIADVDDIDVPFVRVTCHPNGERETRAGLPGILLDVHEQIVCRRRRDAPEPTERPRRRAPHDDDPLAGASGRFHRCSRAEDTAGKRRFGYADSDRGRG